MPRRGKHLASYDSDDYEDGYDDDYYYDDCKDDGSAQSMYSEDPTVTVIPSSTQHSSSIPAVWRCSVCTFDNPQELQSCDICGAIRHKPAPASAAAVKKLNILAAPSVLAKSLFVPLPMGKLKKGSILRQVKDRILRECNSEPCCKSMGQYEDLRPSKFGAQNKEIVPFKFDIPSPDDLVLARKQTPVKNPAGTPVSATKVPLRNEEMGVPLKANIVKKIDGGQSEVIASKDKLRVPSSSTQKNKGTVAEKLSALDLNMTNNDLLRLNGGAVRPLDSYEPEGWMLEEFKDESMQLLHLAIVGHVDAGKSTLMGRILHLLGKVSQKEMHKYEKEAKQTGKGSFSYAWVLDESAEERARGVTMTVAVATFETSKFRVVVLDSPGHRDFVPNMISGASQADAAVLVVDASFGAFEAGLEGEGQGGGQTREHTQLVRSFGVEQLIVAVNKMDAVDYSEERFNAIKATLRPFLRHCGFKDSGIKWVPLSAMDNQNLVTCPSNSQLKTWCSGPSLLEAIDTCELSKRNVAKPFRMPVAEMTRSRTLGQAAISGKIEAGAIKVGQKLVVMPYGSIAMVRGIEQDKKALAAARAGDSIELGLQGVEPSLLIQGGVLCHPEYLVPVASRVELKVLVLENSGPLLRGSQLVFHCHHLKEPAKITDLVSLLDPKTGTVLKKKPRCVLPNQSAIIEVVPERGVCVEEYTRYKALGRVSLRDRGKTLAVGIVTRVVCV